MRDLNSIIKKYYLFMEVKKEDETEDRIRAILDSGQFTMLFSYHDLIYGASEGDRVAYALMKNPREDEQPPDGFLAVSLTDMLQGNPVQKKFEESDLKKIKVVEPEEAISLLRKSGKDNDEKNNIIVLNQNNDSIEKETGKKENLMTFNNFLRRKASQ